MVRALNEGKSRDGLMTEIPKKGLDGYAEPDYAVHSTAQHSTAQHSTAQQSMG